VAPVAIHWLDTLVAVPVIGLRPIRPWSTYSRYANRVSDFVSSLYEDGHQLTVSTPTAWAVSIEGNNGLLVQVSPDNVVFRHQQIVKDVRGPGERPSLVPEPSRTFSEELASLRNHAVKLLRILSGNAGFDCDRVGVMASCRIAEANAPPGVAALAARLDDVWQNPLRTVDAMFLTLTAEKPGFVEQCHHRLKLDRNATPRELEFTLDWQRQSSKNHVLPGSSSIEALLDDCFGKAKAYFEDVGEGGLLDADT
jgi:hypothetical protein